MTNEDPPRYGIRARLAFALLAVGALLLCETAAEAQSSRNLGPSRCLRCHANERSWWESRDGPPPHGHVNALLQLESPEAGRIARRLRIADVYGPQVGCVRCHATVVNDRPLEGVSCESCHGPGSSYITIHARPGAYRLAVAAGMSDIVGQVNVWTRLCLTCHLVDDARLLAAGHPSGTDFDIAAKFSGVALHWKREYAKDTIAAAAKPVLRAYLVELRSSRGRQLEPTTQVKPQVGHARARDDLSRAGVTRSALAALIDVQGRAIARVRALLAQSRGPASVKASPAQDMAYLGMEGELVELQQETLALALRALASASKLSAPQRPPSNVTAPPGNRSQD